MAISLPSDNLAFPAYIEIDKKYTGSGFLFNFENKELYLVTAKHVFFEEAFNKLQSKGKRAKIIGQNDPRKSSGSYELEIDITESLNLKLIKYSNKFDLCICKVAKLNADHSLIFESNCSKKSVDAIFVTVNKDWSRKYEDVTLGNDVFVFGYPSSLGLRDREQIDYLKPLLRKGIVAGKNDKKRTIIIDCPVYYGNSGGLVTEVEVQDDGKKKSYAIGVVKEFVPFIEKWFSVQHRFENLNIENSGYSVVTPIDSIVDIIEDKF